MPTPAQIEEQVKLERKAISQGLNRLHKNTRELEEKSYASATVYGVASIDAMLPLVVERIKETRTRITRGKTGAAFKEISQYLSDLEPLAAAAIACKVTFDRVFTRSSKLDGDPSLDVNVCRAIGQAVEAECQMRYYERVAPGLLRVLKENYWHRSCGTQQKLTVIRTMMNRYEVPPWDGWGSKTRVKLGGWLLDCIISATGWFERTISMQGVRKFARIVPTKEFCDRKGELLQLSEVYAPLAWPMLVEPNPWAPERPGGYLLNEVMRGHEMVRRGSFGPTYIQGQEPYDFLNKIQLTAWKVNPFIYGVASELLEKGRAVGKFIPQWNEEEPIKPPNIAEDDEARKDYRRRKAEWHNRINDNAKKCVRTLKTMECARMFIDKDRYFIPWSFDYRGRAYPIPAYLTPQDTDFGKSLLRFADESYVTPESEQWLAFQVATTYGLDKAPLDERVKWVDENKELISAVASDPISNLPLWEAADEPWQFLAACEEYYSCVVECSRQFTGLPVATDATCSGLQILAGLAQDASTARLVNVLPGDRPQDAYKAVAEACRPHCPEHLREHIDRSVTKRVVMTIPYNAKPLSNRGYIREALKEKGIEISTEDLTILTKEIRAAVERIFPGPMAVMKWIEAEVGEAMKRGLRELEWVSPSGFPVCQRLMKVKTERVELQLMGNAKMTVPTDESDQVDKSKHKSATSPNLIHSLDASLLHLSIARFDAPIGLIHDSVLCRATDMSVLSGIVRQVYMELFAGRSYLEEWAEQIGSQSTPPIIGTLNPESVVESTYFFC